MLTVYDSNQLEVLGDLLAHPIRQPTNSPFVPETVIVQNLDVARWRSYCLADRLGVCAHVHFPFPATFIWELFQRPLMIVHETSHCLIGVNDDIFPRVRHPLSVDRMAQDVRRGDRSRCDDDCYLFREALLSARHCFYIRSVGRHSRDNRIIPSSVLVSELLDTIAHGFYPTRNRRTMPGCVGIDHPLQPFSWRHFTQDIKLCNDAAELCEGGRMANHGVTFSSPLVISGLPVAGEPRTLHPDIGKPYLKVVQLMDVLPRR
jgi:exonuclease V gamma subunit